jgi:hypothetical protein
VKGLVAGHPVGVKTGEHAQRQSIDTRSRNSRKPQFFTRCKTNDRSTCKAASPSRPASGRLTRGADRGLPTPQVRYAGREIPLATAIIAEIRVDMGGQVARVEHLWSWVELCPGLNEGAGKVRHSRPHIRPAWNMARLRGSSGFPKSLL